VIEVKDVYKTFQSGKDKKAVEALKGVSLEIKKGEIFGIIGYSGSGKSTLVRCVNLLEKPDEGTITIGGTDLSKLSDRELRKERRKIGMIFQGFNLLNQDTVYDNIALPLKYSGYKKTEIKEKVSKMLDLVGLSDKADAYPKELSGGQKQRVAIARALATDPEVLLSDEATSALDPQTTSSILQLLKKLNKELNITIVVITHEMDVIEEICDRVAVLDEGRIVESGDILSVFSHPKSRVTNEFVSSFFQLSKVNGLLEKGVIKESLENGGVFARLLFTGESANEAYISDVSIKYGTKASIVFGNIEVLGDEPLGNLYVVFEGGEGSVLRAIDSLVKDGVEVEILAGNDYRKEVAV